jgi:uncharacterized protein (TIGR00369 family)
MSDAMAHVRKLLEHKVPFNVFLGMRLTELTDGCATIELPFRPELVGDRTRPALHGGVLSALIDVTGAAAGLTKVHVERGDALSTIDLRVDFLLPARTELVAASARVARMGNRVCVADVRAYHPSAPEVTVATGKGVYSVYQKRR